MVLIECIIMNKCRLCHNKPGQYEINADKKLIKEIYECIKVKVNDKSMNLLPRCVCEECRKMIKHFFLYKQHIQRVDESLRKILMSTTKCHNDNLDGSGLNIFKCPECPATFNIQNLLKKHTKTHICDKLHNREENITTCVDKKEFLDCHRCKKTFNNESEYGSHGCSIKLSNSNVCQNKDEKQKISQESWGDTISELQRENKSLSTNGDNETKGIGEKSNFETEKVLSCSVCEQKFSTSLDLKIHKRNHKKFVCSWKNCEKVLNSAYTLKTHELKHEGKRSFLCVTCGKGFITKNSLTCHEKIHLEIKGYTCKLCNIGFSVRSNLRAHEKKHHEGIRFYCSQCTKAFVSKCSLERHERIHTGVKEFQCESCPSAFYTNKELVKHQRYHQGLRLHKCDECFKTFFERHHLIIHLRSHTGERPYVCKIPNCGKSFMESQKLKRHHNARHAQT